MREHSRLRRRVVTVAAGVAAMVLVPVASLADTTEVTVSNARVRVGEQIQVTGTGFTPGEKVTVAVCGAANASGRLACGKGLDDVVVGSDGTVTQDFKVHEPDGACPCTVVIDSAGRPPATTRIDLLGYAMAEKPMAPEIVVDSATIVPSKGVGHWFGLAPEPTLELVLRNAGASSAQPALDLAWSAGDGKPQSLVDAGVTVIEPGQSVEYVIPLNFGALARGEHTVSGQVVVGDLFADVEASTSVAPWGLYVVLVLGLVGGGVLGARRLSGSSARPATDAPAAAPRRTAPPRTVPSQRAPQREPSREPSRASHRPESREPAYVGPPRLEATPLAPLAPRPKPPEQQLSPLERLSAAAPQRAGRQSDAPSAPLPPVPSRGVAPADPERARTTVAEALSAIAESSADAPARLPDPYEVPPQPGKRAERGGKRAARPARGGWITRR